MGQTVRTVTTTGLLDPTTCWQRYYELDQWAKWAPHITGVEATSDVLTLGLTGRVRVTGGLEVPFVVTSVDLAARRWSWIARPLGITLSLSHAIEASPVGTRATLVIEGPALVVVPYAPLGFVALRRLVSPSATD